MKKIILTVLAFFAFGSIQAQILNPVTWETRIEKISKNGFLLIFEGKIDADWHLYSQFTPAGGPLPLEIIFKDAKGNFELIGKAKESKTTTAFNDVFEVNETFFKNTVQISQEIKWINTQKIKIDAVLNYQVCKDVCINQEKKISFTLPAVVAPKREIVAAPVAIANPKQENKHKNQSLAALKKERPEKKATSANLWTVFLLSFVGGLAALLTPCVFPMIPMTVSFFTKQSKNRALGIRNALLYGLSIIFIYVGLGSMVTALFGADALNALATNAYFNTLFFVLLVVFAASFLGAFDIVLPHSWANKIDQQADKGGVLGILFMALALAIVSFSCTGPIVGDILFASAAKGGLGPIIGMFGFSLALALPFMLFALFPAWLQTLPKSGSWLNSVKVFLGFLELALAFKFLSNADLVLQLHLLEREVFLSIWIAIFGTLTLYLFGKINLPHDGQLPHLGVGRLFLGLLVLSFTIYMIPGLWGAPVKLINAFVPPIEYSESPNGIGISAERPKALLPAGAQKGPQGLVVFTDYEKGLAHAKKTNKPIMLDFTGHACVNCRKMESQVWSDFAVLSMLKNQVVIISLYVDDQRNLPKKEQFISKKTGASIETIGDKWTDFMITTYQTNTQPLYVLTDLKGISLNQNQPTISYASVKDYRSWLETGILNFKK